MEPCLQEFATAHGLYLDKKGPRPARRGSKVSWKDLNGNMHDLDFVIETGGSAVAIGIPVAFIETAWRRYTKHSRNKAQEIQGAVMPLAETYASSSPFKGVVLAGMFTDGALNQLDSLGFTVLYFPYQAIVEVFESVGIEAAYDEDTPDEAVERAAKALEDLSPTKRATLGPAILRTNADGLKQFMEALRVATARQIVAVIIVALHGPQVTLKSVGEAVAVVVGYDENQCEGPFRRYEIEVRYSNGDSIKGSFADKTGAIEFLRQYEAPSIVC